MSFSKNYRGNLQQHAKQFIVKRELPTMHRTLMRGAVQPKACHIGGGLYPAVRRVYIGWYDDDDDNDELLIVNKLSLYFTYHVSVCLYYLLFKIYPTTF